MAKKKLSVPEKHQLNIAKKTLGYSDIGANIMGGMTKDEARKFLKSIGYTDREIKKMEESKLTENNFRQMIRNMIMDALTNEEEEIDEMTTTGDVAGYQTPAAFVGQSGKQRKERWHDIVTKRLGYETVWDEEDADELGAGAKKRSNYVGKNEGTNLNEGKVFQFTTISRNGTKTVSKIPVETESEAHSVAALLKKSKNIIDVKYKPIVVKEGKNYFVSVVEKDKITKVLGKESSETKAENLAKKSRSKYPADKYDIIIQPSKIEKEDEYKNWFNESVKLTEAANPKKGRKSYYTMDNLGSSKYSISYYDGKSTHKDGSPFYGLMLFNNKKKYEDAMNDLQKKGYIEESIIKEEKYLTPDEYRKLSDKKIEPYYNKWLKNNKFIKFTSWETKVLNGDIRLVKEGTDEIAKIYIGGDPYWLRKIGDTTHFHMANSEKGIKAGGWTYHIGQHKDELYYNDLVKWLKGGKINGKKYKGFFRQLSKENVIKEANGHEVELFWKGLKGNDAKIGRFVVSPKTYNDIEDDFGHELAIDLYDDKVSGKQMSLKDVINAMKKTKYGKLVFKNESITEGRRGQYQIYRDDASKTAQQKIGESIQRMRKSLKELNREIDLNLRLKNESGIEGDAYWKRTKNDLYKVSEHIHKLLEKIRRF